MLAMACGFAFMGGSLEKSWVYANTLRLVIIIMYFTSLH